MKKKLLLLGAILGLGLCVGLGTNNYTPVFAEGEQEVAVETYTIKYEQPEHGKVVIAEEDLEGEVGKAVTIDIQPSMFYMIESVTVNGTALVESETTKGIYTFNPVAGENVIAIKIVTDSALIEEFNALALQVKNKDWASIFSVETVTRLIAIVLNSSLLVAMVSYFIRDKRLAKSVGDKVQGAVEKIVPEQTKEAVIMAVEKQITPIFEDNKADMLKIVQAISVLCKCMALSQENNAESRKAILDELASLEIGDMATIAQIKDYIHTEIAKKQKEYEDNMAAIKEIQTKHNAVVEEEHTEEHNYDGTEI